MADWRTELQLILTGLADDATAKVVALLGRMDRLDRAEALAFVTEAFPGLIIPYLSAGGDLGATVYEDLPGGVQGFAPVVAELPSNDQLGINIRWLLLNGSPDAVRGTMTRLVNNAVRDTQFANLAAEYGDPVLLDDPSKALGTMWARHASANACGFCRMLATRKAAYRSKESAERVTGRGVDLTQADHRNIAMGLMTREGALSRRSVYRSAGQAARQGKQVGDKRKSGRTRGIQKLGDKFHDHCRCLAVPVRPGSRYEPPDYVQQWEKDYQAASGAIPDGTDYQDVPKLISSHMDNADGGSGPQRREGSAKRRQQKRHGERRRGQPGGPSGSPPPKPPSQGGKGYSDDDHERRLEWEFDDAMRRRMKSKDGSIDDVLERAHALQQYRAVNGISGRLDERFGKPFDADEWVVVEKLLSEGRNVSSLAVLRTGDSTPDMAVDARVAEIKTSNSAKAAAFEGRVRQSWEKQGAPYVFVNAVPSLIDPRDMRAKMESIISDGDSMYIRVIGKKGSGFDGEYGKW